MVASDISSETFIANVGIAYQYGMVARRKVKRLTIYSIFLVCLPAGLCGPACTRCRNFSSCGIIRPADARSRLHW